MASGWNICVWLECIGRAYPTRSFQNQDHTNMAINYIDKNVRRLPETSTCEVPRDVSRKLQLTLCAIMVS